MTSPIKLEKVVLVVPMSNLLALDQASRTTGWSVFIDGKLLKYGKFTVSEEDIGERLYSIKNHVQNLITEYEINEIVFEDIQLQNNVMNNVQTFKILAEVFGILEELFTELKIPHTAVLAASWKSTLEIKGKSRPEQKKNAQLYVEQTYNIKATQDESDSICIGSHYLANSKVEAGFDWSE